jgi:SAM-dependent methyltransferase
MRDPQGRIEFSGERVLRHLEEPLAAAHFLHGSAARALIDAGSLLPYESLDDRTLSAPRVAWVSQPSEWCGAQLLDAARLTLDVAERALAERHELKDASAWNVLFDGCRPVFCDHLSFAPIARREWHAFGQFARHFALPLAVARLRGLAVNEQFRMYRDGMSPALARSLCGWRRFTVAAGLLMSGSRAPAHRKDGAPAAQTTAASYHPNLLRFARSTLPVRTALASRSTWSNYTDSRTHYDAESLAHKRAVVERWLARIGPRWALDLGCNTGEFSRLAAAAGARVVAVDSDHDSIDRLYRGERGGKHANAIHPVVARLDDLAGSRGWAGEESPGIAPRFERSCDVVMMLALLHHLMLAASIPPVAIAAFAARVTRAWAIVEVVGESDPMFAGLAAHFDRQADAAHRCGREAQIAAFGAHFDIVAREPLPHAPRELLLLRRRDSGTA